MNLKKIKTEQEYKEILSQIDQLLDIDPDPDTDSFDLLQVLVLLVENYESEKFQFSPPDPIDAIQFRMEQQNLTHRDLVPFIGSRSKVSEVLSRKRPLTLQMIRALHTNLGIPAPVLLRQDERSLLDEGLFDWGRFPILEMINLGWIKTTAKNPRKKGEGIMKNFFSDLGSDMELVIQFRMTENIRAAKSMDRYALMAWTARVILKAKKMAVQKKGLPATVDINFMKELARLSWSDKGPLLAQEFLANNGIPLVVERHLSKTHLDGAAIMVKEHYPIIGMTIRYDRLDNFWFTLMHELAHISLHLGNDPISFYDDLECDSRDNIQEREADLLASEALIPEHAWNTSEASVLRSPEAAEKLANRLGIHPAIVAGRMRHHFKLFRLLNNLVGHRKVRTLFPEVNWRKHNVRP